MPTSSRGSARSGGRRLSPSLTGAAPAAAASLRRRAAPPVHRLPPRLRWRTLSARADPYASPPAARCIAAPSGSPRPITCLRAASDPGRAPFGSRRPGSAEIRRRDDRAAVRLATRASDRSERPGGPVGRYPGGPPAVGRVLRAGRSWSYNLRRSAPALRHGDERRR
jgi:hypothetical protein